MQRIPTLLRTLDESLDASMQISDVNNKTKPINLINLNGERFGLMRPKKWSVPYMFYVKDQRAKVGKENPELPFREVVGLMSKNWARISDEEKSTYKEQSR